MKHSVLASLCILFTSKARGLPHQPDFNELLARIGGCTSSASCPAGMCCSNWGYCGSGPDYCGGGGGGDAFPGLDAIQSRNAAAAIGEVLAEGLGRQACLAVIGTAFQESALYIYANPAVPESMNYPNDFLGGDQDSVGMFQQCPEWFPDIAAGMSAAGSTAQFLNVMRQVPGWETMEVSLLDQTVQNAEAGNLYGQHIALAIQVCGAAGFWTT